MVTAQPQPKGPALLNELILLGEKGELTPFALKRCKREAEGLLSADPFNAYMSLGFIAAFNKDEAEVHRIFEFLEKTYPQENKRILPNHSVALIQLGRTRDSLSIKKKMFDQGWMNSEGMLKTFLSFGLYESGGEWVKQHPESSEITQIINLLKQAEHFLGLADCREDSTNRLIAIALSTLRQNDIHSEFHFQFQVLEDEEDQWIVTTFFLPLPPDEVARLNGELADALAESDIPPMVTTYFHVGFSTARGG
ncbi:MAG: hypothetical protein OEW12_07980 [Deltaproteobacteria bacterium]|nr:hypothetical protein [Deltaproteobacteria bacterium]